MQDSVAARKYARALFAEAQKANQLLACQQGLEEIVRVGLKKPSLRQVLSHPSISADEKKGMMHSVMSEYATPLLERFVALLVRKHRFDLLPAILQEFKREVDVFQNIQSLKVRTALPMTETQQKALEARMEKWLGAKVRMEIQVDPSLIGGIVVQTRDLVLDESLKSQLKRLQKQLTA